MPELSPSAAVFLRTTTTAALGADSGRLQVSVLRRAAADGIEAGLLLAAAYLVTRRLWIGIGAHMAWTARRGHIVPPP